MSEEWYTFYDAFLNLFVGIYSKEDISVRVEFSKDTFGMMSDDEVYRAMKAVWVEAKEQYEGTN